MRVRCANSDSELWPKCICSKWKVESAESWRESLELPRPQNCTCDEVAACGNCLQVVVDEVDKQQIEKVLWRGISPDVWIFSGAGKGFGAHWLALACCGATALVGLRWKKSDSGNVGGPAVQSESASETEEKADSKLRVATPEALNSVRVVFGSAGGCEKPGSRKRSGKDDCSADEVAVEIHMINTDDDTVEHFLDWLYARCIPEDGKALCALLKFSQTWQVPLLENAIRSLLNKRQLSSRTMLDLLVNCYDWDDSELFDFCLEEVIVRKSRNEFTLEDKRDEAEGLNKTSREERSGVGVGNELPKDADENDPVTLTRTLEAVAGADPQARLVLKSLLAAAKFVTNDASRKAELCLELKPVAVDEDKMDIGMCRDNAFQYFAEDDFPILAHSNFGDFFLGRRSSELCDSESRDQNDEQELVATDPYWDVCHLETYTYKRSFPVETIVKYSDIQLESRELDVFQTYKAVLFAASDVFRDSIEQNSNSVKLGSGSGTVEALVKWLHCRDIPDDITLAEMQRLYALAREWRIWGLVSTLETQCTNRSFLELLKAEDCIKILGARVRDRNRSQLRQPSKPSRATKQASPPSLQIPQTSKSGSERQQTSSALSSVSTSRSSATPPRKPKISNPLSTSPRDPGTDSTASGDFPSASAALHTPKEDSPVDNRRRSTSTKAVTSPAPKPLNSPKSSASPNIIHEGIDGEKSSTTTDAELHGENSPHVNPFVLDANTAESDKNSSETPDTFNTFGDSTSSTTSYLPRLAANIPLDANIDFSRPPSVDTLTLGSKEVVALASSVIGGRTTSAVPAKHRRRSSCDISLPTHNSCDASAVSSSPSPPASPKSSSAVDDNAPRNSPKSPDPREISREIPREIPREIHQIPREIPREIHQIPIASTQSNASTPPSSGVTSVEKVVTPLKPTKPRVLKSVSVLSASSPIATGSPLSSSAGPYIDPFGSPTSS